MSAQPDNVLPFPVETPSLAKVVSRWVALKQQEDRLKAERLAVEELICQLSPPSKQEGATTVDVGDYKMTLTASLNYKVDNLAAVREITSGWSADLVPLKTKTELDPTGCKWLRANRPDLWAELAKAITVAPAKVNVKVSI